MTYVTLREAFRFASRNISPSFSLLFGLLEAGSNGPGSVLVLSRSDGGQERCDGSKVARKST
jgi:hypothetical protein